MGVERKSLTMTEHEHHRGHESGHAVVAALLPHADPLHKVRSSRAAALGVTMQLPEGDRHTYTRESSRRNRDPDGWPRRRRAVPAPDDERRRQRHRRATEIARRRSAKWYVGARTARLRTPGNPWDTDRGAGISGRRRSASTKRCAPCDDRLRDGTADHRQAPERGARDGRQLLAVESRGRNWRSSRHRC
jgi:hypothetical protein